MYLAFNSEIHIHETTPPTDITKLWTTTLPVARFIPTTNVVMDSHINVIDYSKQLLTIYEFESIPQIFSYSSKSNQWEVCVGAYKILSDENYVLKDSNGVLLITKKG